MKKDKKQEIPIAPTTPANAETPVMKVLNALGAEFRKRGKTTVVLNLTDGGQFVWFADDVMSMAIQQTRENLQKKS